ncbi:hypothetical protein JQ604_16785 [Bradyrhizobium jicamae]|uniref:DUF6894 family protein n=1 Tax=Bradyrhizobium jicamae TaxID=280332 RepID=UPI001BAB9D31|nr:hypothetical protein [Bradyrhizobium jicamae]MBR0753841.1 hypothetical protein [Bradyrhizobium jicamae]
MPHFFFHYTSEGQRYEDTIGSDFSSLEAAYIDTCRAALEMSVEKLKIRKDPKADAFEIAGADGTPLMDVPFGEVLVVGRPSFRAPKRRIDQAIQDAERKVQRSRVLRAELQANCARVRATLESIQRTLGR